jgi:hypothetical protein
MECEREKRLRISGLFRDWKADIILFTRDKIGVYF